MPLAVCPHLHPRKELQGGFAIYPVPRPLYLHDPPRPAYDAFNATLRANYNPDYQWGDAKRGHGGVDLGAVSKPVRVSQPEGRVRAVDLTDNSSAGVHVDILTKCPECSGWFLFRYLHLAAGSVKVTPGQLVKQGDLIGTQGKTGNSHWYHSHFEIRHTTLPTADSWTTYGSSWGIAYDPLAWLDAPVVPTRKVKPSDETIDRLVQLRLIGPPGEYWKGLPIENPDWVRFKIDPTDARWDEFWTAVNAAALAS